jgi:uncharacterized membrane protein YjgN (DUF898 family)
MLQRNEYVSSASAGFFARLLSACSDYRKWHVRTYRDLKDSARGAVTRKSEFTNIGLRYVLELNIIVLICTVGLLCYLRHVAEVS